MERTGDALAIDPDLEASEMDPLSVVLFHVNYSLMPDIYTTLQNMTHAPSSHHNDSGLMAMGCSKVSVEGCLEQKRGWIYRNLGNLGQKGSFLCHLSLNNAKRTCQRTLPWERNHLICIPFPQLGNAGILFIIRTRKQNLETRLRAINETWFVDVPRVKKLRRWWFFLCIFSVVTTQVLGLLMVWNTKSDL